MSLTAFFRRSQAPTTTPVRDAATDALIDSYVAWREASSEVQAAYERWEAWASPNRDLAFAGYLAALEQEEHAARVYKQRIDRVRRSFCQPPVAGGGSEAP